MPGPRSPIGGGYLPSLRPGDETTDREWFAAKLKEQTDELRKMSDDRDRSYDARFTALERSAVSNDRLALQVERLLDSDARQNGSIAALTEALKPSVEATASIEGGKAGKAEGKFSGRLWGLVGSALALVIAGALQQCQRQIERGAFDTVLVPAPSASK